MPTGYSAPVLEGKIKTLPEFALLCARAFGACVNMRDDSMSADIPEEFPVSDYHSKAYKQASRKLNRLNSLNSAAHFLNGRKVLQDAVDFQWANLPKSGDYDTRYGELNKAEKELDESDTKWLTWIVENRKILD